MGGKRTRGRLRAVGRVAVLTGGLLIALLPLGWTLLAALGLQPDGRGWHGTLTIDHFTGVGVFEPTFGAEWAYTLLVTGTATLLTVVVARSRRRTAWPGCAPPGAPGSRRGYWS